MVRSARQASVARFKKANGFDEVARNGAMRADYRASVSDSFHGQSGDAVSHFVPWQTVPEVGPYFFDHIIILGFILDPQAPVRLVD